MNNRPARIAIRINAAVCVCLTLLLITPVIVQTCGIAASEAEKKLSRPHFPLVLTAAFRHNPLPTVISIFDEAVTKWSEVSKKTGQKQLLVPMLGDPQKMGYRPVLSWNRSEMKSMSGDGRTGL
jgi:hypothetical protein